MTSSVAMRRLVEMATDGIISIKVITSKPKIRCQTWGKTNFSGDFEFKS